MGRFSAKDLLLVCPPFPRVPEVVAINVLLPLLGNFRENLLDGAFWNTSTTVQAPEKATFYTIMYKKYIKVNTSKPHVGDFSKGWLSNTLPLRSAKEWEKQLTSLFAVPARKLSTDVEE